MFGFFLNVGVYGQLKSYTKQVNNSGKDEIKRS